VLDAVLLVARLLLATVFVLSGVTKLADRAGSRAGMLGFGVPKLLAGPLAASLPIVEIVLAAALVPVATAWWGAAGLVTLVMAFTVVISVNLIHGRRPACHCFGQLSPGPIGWPTLARNLVLGVVAGVSFGKVRPMRARARQRGWVAWHRSKVLAWASA
jgi:hypothetical protein